MTTIKIPELCVVTLIGVSGSGKSTFAARHFLPTEVISSDFCRGLVGDDENDQSVTNAAFEVLHFIAGKRLEAGKLCVIDATNVQAESRRSLINTAKAHHVLSVAVVLDVGEKECAARNAAPPGTTVRFPRDQEPELAASPLPQGTTARGLPPGLPPEGRRGDRGGHVRARAPVERPADRPRTLRHHRGHPRLPCRAD